jgi:hypothetical protein
MLSICPHPKSTALTNKITVRLKAGLTALLPSSKSETSHHQTTVARRNLTPQDKAKASSLGREAEARGRNSAWNTTPRTPQAEANPARPPGPQIRFAAAVPACQRRTHLDGNAGQELPAALAPGEGLRAGEGGKGRIHPHPHIIIIIFFFFFFLFKLVY